MRRLFLNVICVLLTLGTIALGFAAGGFLALRYHAALLQMEQLTRLLKKLLSLVSS